MFTPSAARALLTRIIARGRRQGWMHWRPNWQLSANRQFSFCFAHSLQWRPKQSCFSECSLWRLLCLTTLQYKALQYKVGLLNYVTRLITPGGNKARAHLVTSSSGQTYYQNILSSPGHLFIYFILTFV